MIHYSHMYMFSLVEARCYKPEIRRFDSSWGYWIFHWLNPSDRPTALRSTQPL